jgi:hypothetical protein
MPSPGFTLTGNLADLLNGADTGYVQITLANYGNVLPEISGTGLIANTSYKANADGSGHFSATIWGNDQITPANTYYVVRIFSPTGGQSPAVPYSFTGAGGDLSTLTPLITIPAASYNPNAVVTNPTGSQTIVQPSGTNLLVNRFEGIRFADQFSGSDIGAQINAAIADLGTGGGIIIVPKGVYTFSTTINLDDKRDITLMGAGGQTGGAVGATELIYTGTGVIVSAKSSTSLHFDGFQIVWSNASFVGPVMDFGHSGSGFDTVWAQVTNCGFFKSVAGGIAPLIISFDKVIDSSIRHCTFHNAVTAFRGAVDNTSYCNAVEINHCEFAADITTAAITNITQGGSITNCTFELGTTYKVLDWTGSTSGAGIFFGGNWTGDSTSAAPRTLINWLAYGTMTGNFLGGSQTFDTTISLGAGAFASISGNAFSGSLVAINSSSATSRISGGSNLYTNTTTSLGGTTPTVGGFINLANDQIKTFGTWVYTGQILGDTGTLAAPSYGFSNASSNTGFFFNGNGRTQLSHGGVAGPVMDSTGLWLGSSQPVKFTSAADPNASADTGLSRTGVGILGIGNGTAGDVTGTINAAKHLAADGTAPAPSFAFVNNTGSGIYNVSGTISFAVGGALKAFINGNINLATNTGMYTLGSSNDTSLTRISAANVAIGNGTTSDSSGTLSVLGVAAIGVNNLTFSTNGSARWFVASGGAFAPSTDAANNLGGLVNRAVNGYFSGSLIWTDGAGSADSSIFRNAAATWGFGTGTTANSNGNLIANVFAASADIGATQNARLQPGGVALGSAKTLVWSSTATATGGADVGLSRDSAGAMAIGNGTAGDITGNLKLSKITSYAGVTTVSNGVAAQYVNVDLTAQGADIGTTTLYAVPANGAGYYRVQAYIILNRAATTSSTRPQVNLFWTDKDNSTVQTFVILGVDSANNLTTPNSSIPCSLSAKASTNIQYSTSGYATSGATSMQYSLKIRLEYLGP